MEVFPPPPEKEKKEKRARTRERLLMEGGGSGSGFNGFHGVPRSNAGSLPPNTARSVQIPAAEQNNSAAPNHRNGGGGAVREQDRLMPIANVIRIMRKVLPSHAKISDDAKETIQECVSEYISFITSEANERCQREQRKTITAEDVLWAMSKLGFDDYVEPLGIYLRRYRELEGDHRGSLRGESLPPLKRQPSQLLQQPPHDMQQHPQLFAPPQQMVGGLPPPSFHVTPPAVTAMPLPHHGMYGEGMGGYFMGMYGDGGAGGSSGGGRDGGNGASSSTQFPMPGFEHYGGYK